MKLIQYKYIPKRKSLGKITIFIISIISTTKTWLILNENGRNHSIKRLLFRFRDSQIFLRVLLFILNEKKNFQSSIIMISFEQARSFKACSCQFSYSIWYHRGGFTRIVYFIWCFWCSNGLNTLHVCILYICYMN